MEELRKRIYQFREGFINQMFIGAVSEFSEHVSNAGGDQNLTLQDIFKSKKIDSDFSVSAQISGKVPDGFLRVENNNCALYSYFKGFSYSQVSIAVFLEIEKIEEMSESKNYKMSKTEWDSIESKLQSSQIVQDFKERRQFIQENQDLAFLKDPISTIKDYLKVIESHENQRQRNIEYIYIILPGSEEEINENPETKMTEIYTKMYKNLFSSASRNGICISVDPENKNKNHWKLELHKDTKELYFKTYDDQFPQKVRYYYENNLEKKINFFIFEDELLVEKNEQKEHFLIQITRRTDKGLMNTTTVIEFYEKSKMKFSEWLLKDFRTIDLEADKVTFIVNPVFNDSLGCSSKLSTQITTINSQNKMKIKEHLFYDQNRALRLQVFTKFSFTQYQKLEAFWVKIVNSENGNSYKELNFTNKGGQAVARFTKNQDVEGIVGFPGDFFEGVFYPIGYHSRVFSNNIEVKNADYLQEVCLGYREGIISSKEKIEFFGKLEFEQLYAVDNNSCKEKVYKGTVLKADENGNFKILDFGKTMKTGIRTVRKGVNLNRFASKSK